MVKIKKNKIKFNRGFTPLEKATDRKRNSLTGFTLLEIMVVVGLLAFIMSAIFGILASARRTWATGEALISLQQEGSLGLDRMVRELRLCQTATVGANPNSVRFNIPIDATGPGGIPDGFVDLTSEGAVVYGAENQANWNIQYEIDVVTNQIIRRVLNDANPAVEVTSARRIVVKNINPLLTYFQTKTGGTGITTDAVKIGLGIKIGAMEGLTLNPPLEIKLSTQVNLRN